MNDRSTGVSSTWSEHGSISDYSSDASSAEDSDVTPKASRQSDSLDLADFQPPPVTPGTAKRTLFRFRNKTSPNKATQAPTVDQPKKERKGLRKSISTWNFHHLGDKMKIFGGSTNELAQESAVSGKTSKDDVKASEAAVLNERKRKAGEAYAAQFGLKKQKSNSGLAVEDEDVAEKPPRQTASMRRRSLGQLNTSTTSSRSRRRKSANMTEIGSSDLDSSDHDNRKHRSLEELEKENQQLRALLRVKQTRTARVHRSSSMASLYEDDTMDEVITATPGESNGRSREKIPPVPKLPDRAILGNLSNGQNAKGPTTRASDTAAVKGAHNPLPRPVSMILEVPEEADLEDKKAEDKQAEDKNSKCAKPVDAVVPRKEEWEWPEDCF